MPFRGEISARESFYARTGFKWLRIEIKRNVNSNSLFSVNPHLFTMDYLGQNVNKEK